MNDVKILVVFHTDEGHTTKVAAQIAARIQHGGGAVDLRTSEDAPSPDGYDGVVVGDSVHRGHHSHALIDYVKAHGRAMGVMPSALFQVSFTSATQDEAHDRLSHDIAQKLIDKTGWEPDFVGLFAGAIAYTRYGWFKRRTARHLSEAAGLGTDTGQDYDYTDWDAVDEFADHVLAHVRDEVGQGSS